MRPFAIVLVMITPWATFGIAYSAAYRAPPVTLSRPSTRSSGAPTLSTRRFRLAVPCHAVTSVERAHQRALREQHLECIVAMWPCFGQRRVCRVTEGPFAWPLSDQNVLRFGRPPRLRGDTAQARRARRESCRPPASTATAADARANAKLARSRTLRYSERRAAGIGGRSIVVIRSPGCNIVSRSGCEPGQHVQ